MLAKQRTASWRLNAVEIRMRATRRLGELMREQKTDRGAQLGRPSPWGIGIPRGTSARRSSRKASIRTSPNRREHSAILPEEKFESRVAEAREAALGVVDKVVRAQARETAKHESEQPYGRPTDHPSAPYELRQKAKQQRSKAAKLSRMAPSTLDGWRRGYINACRHAAPDLDAELQLIVDALHELAGERLGASRRAER